MNLWKAAIAAFFVVGADAKNGPNRLFNASKQAKVPRPSPIPSRRPSPNGLFNASKQSKEPTNRPSPIPSRRPSNLPTRRPSQSPSNHPASFKPTPNPSQSPSKHPVTPFPTSQSPTKRPVTSEPSLPPSGRPFSAFPTSGNPLTSEPSVNPTASKSSKFPTVAPVTSSPSASASARPSSSPSSERSSQPSDSPSESPSALLSASPSESASSAPSAMPSLQPSPFISSSASPSPTASLSALTNHPSESPSLSPSTIPLVTSHPSSTTSPSHSPVTSEPSQNPTSQSPMTSELSPSDRPISDSPTSASPTNNPSNVCNCETSSVSGTTTATTAFATTPFTTTGTTTAQSEPIRKLGARLRLSEPPTESHTEFVTAESVLESIIYDPPSFVSEAESSGLTIDIVSLGSVTRMDYLTAQIETWASHRGVRHYWGFSELQDFDPECSSMSEEARSAVVDTCKVTEAFKDPKIKSFSEEFYGLSEGNHLRSGDAGWVCAQRRVGRALGWLHSQYSGGKTDVPDYLLVVDDDTYVDLVDVMSYLEIEKTEHAGAFARAGCVFQKNNVIPFPITYGGFGTILNKAAVQQLTEPVYCSGKDLNQDICAQIKADKVGEASVFQEGMSTFELFFKYSSWKHYCMHSDWLLSYILEYYLSHPQLDEHSLVGMKSYPSCGNITIATGAVRPCTPFSDTCHNQNPKDMEALSISSYSQSPESYKSMPKMMMTELDIETDTVRDAVIKNGEIRLPNVLVFDSDSSDWAVEFFTSNGACRPSNAVQYDVSDGFYDAEMHCSDGSLLFDVSSMRLMQPKRLSELYKQAGSDLKLIVVVRGYTFEHYGHYLDTWAHYFERDQMLVISSFELQDRPDNSHWRIEQFLHKSFPVELESVSVISTVPPLDQQDLKDIHDEFYTFIDSTIGPWMEETPFPRFQGDHSRFAFATVLGWNPRSTQMKLYVDAVRVLIRSLRNKSKADIVVIMLYEDKYTEELLTSEGAVVKRARRIEHSQDIKEFEPWFVDISFAKLRAFELTEYERVQYFDADVAIQEASALDELFVSFPNAKLVAEGLGFDSPLRAGWMMIKPSQVDFDSMEDILKHGSFDTSQGWDSLGLPVNYPGWIYPKSDWNFYGSSLEQGLLFHYFYALPKWSANDDDLLKLVNDEEVHQLGLYHFYGDRKPWSNVRAELPVPGKVAQERWLAMYKTLDTIQVPDLYEYVAPLTKVGSEQYSEARVLDGYLSPTAAPTPCICAVDSNTSAEPV